MEAALLGRRAVASASESLIDSPPPSFPPPRFNGGVDDGAPREEIKDAEEGGGGGEFKRGARCRAGEIIEKLINDSKGADRKNKSARHEGTTSCCCCLILFVYLSKRKVPMDYFLCRRLEHQRGRDWRREVGAETIVACSSLQPFDLSPRPRPAPGGPGGRRRRRPSTSGPRHWSRIYR